MFVIFYLFSSCAFLSPLRAETSSCLAHWCAHVYPCVYLYVQAVLAQKLLRVVDRIDFLCSMDGAARRVRGQARTEGELVTSSRGKGFPFLSQVYVKVHLYAFLSGSNRLMITLTGTGASLLNVHVHGLCDYGHASISSSPNIQSSLLLLE